METRHGGQNIAHGKRIYHGTTGKQADHRARPEELSQEQELILLCGHYEGVDQRALDEVH